MGGGVRALAADGLLPARVAIEFNHIFRLYAESRRAAGPALGTPAAPRRGQAGARRRSATGSRPGRRRARPWPPLKRCLPRRSRFSRKVAGELTEEQIVAANIDTVFLVMGLDGDYNPRRLERYLVMAHESGASPVVLLNKSDVAADHLSADMDEISSLAVGIPVHAISARTGAGPRRLRALHGPGPDRRRCSDRRGRASPRSSTR